MLKEPLDAILSLNEKGLCLTTQSVRSKRSFSLLFPIKIYFIFKEFINQLFESDYHHFAYEIMLKILTLKDNSYWLLKVSVDINAPTNAYLFV